MEVARAFGAVAVTTLMRGAAVVRAVVGARVRVNVVASVVVAKRVFDAKRMVIPMRARAHRVSMDVAAAAGIERDADRVARGHADRHLRKQEERKHETEDRAPHGDWAMYRPVCAVGQGLNPSKA